MAQEETNQPSPVLVRQTVRHPQLGRLERYTAPSASKDSFLTPTKKERKKAKTTHQFFLPNLLKDSTCQFPLLFCHHIPLRNVAALRGWDSIINAATENQLSTRQNHMEQIHSVLTREQNVQQRHVRAKPEQAFDLKKEGKAKASLQHLVPNLLQKLLCNSPLDVLPPHPTPFCHSPSKMGETSETLRQ